MAVVLGRRSAAEALIGAGADVNQPDGDGRTPLGLRQTSPGEL